MLMDYKRVEVDNTDNKRSLLEQIKLINDPMYLIPMDAEGLNLSVFVSDVFRRNGNYVNILVSDDEPMSMCILILPFKGMVEEIQITRDDTLETLIENVNTNSTYKIIRACGTSISTAWMYSKHLAASNEWFYCNNITINSIPVKIDRKIVYKTTLYITMQKSII
jgi:hypothetical protein